jgi:hypothetical protein
MGLGHGTNIASTKNLVFAYDMGNTLKSWKGKPTTNLANVGLVGMSGVSLTYLGIENGWKKYSMNGTFTGGTYPYIMHISSVAFTGGVTYSSACYIKTNAISKFNYFGIGMNYVNVPMNKGGTSFGVLQKDGSYYCGRNNFEYTGNTTQPGYILSNPINNTTFSASTDFVWIKEGQVEMGEFSTPFAGDAGTRSNAQAIIDLTGKNTVTIGNLSYASNNTFSFSGSNLTIPYSSTFDFSQAQTIIMWLKPGTGANSARRNPYNQAFGGSGTITHETSGAFNYYFGTHGGNNSPYVGRGSSFTVGVNELAFIAVTRSQSLNVCRWYKNGSLITTANAGGYASTNNGSSDILIGTGYTTNFIGDIYQILLYNRFFSDAEILQTFNALRGRYGI